MESYMVFFNKELNKKSAFKYIWNKYNPNKVKRIDLYGYTEIDNVIMDLFEENRVEKIFLEETNFILLTKEILITIKEKMLESAKSNLSNKNYRAINLDALERIDNTISLTDKYKFIYYHYDF